MTSMPTTTFRRILDVSLPPPPHTRSHRRGNLFKPRPPRTVTIPLPPLAAGGSQQQQPESLADVMANIAAALAAMQQPQPVADAPRGADLWASGLQYHPPGAPEPLLRDVSLHLPPCSLGLIFGRSGAGKTTLLQLLAGLLEPSAGVMSFSGALPPQAAGLTGQQRTSSAGLVFQFPERHFVGGTLAEELTTGWPAGDTPQGLMARQALAQRVPQVMAAVGLDSLPVTTQLSRLSDGFKRRVALAVQLVRRPQLLLLDEPLAGLDWRTREELTKLLGELKRECTVVVVSHDLRELAPLVDRSWRMRAGGVLQEEALEEARGGGFEEAGVIG